MNWSGFLGCLLLVGCAGSNVFHTGREPKDWNGTCFIAEGRFMTAAHIFPSGDRVGIDTVDYGPAPRRGFEITRVRPDLGDLVWVVFAEWPGLPERAKGMVVSSDDSEGFIQVFSAVAAFGGVSGTPVLAKDGKVLGSLSAMNTEEQRYLRVSLFFPEPGPSVSPSLPSFEDAR